jgi:hypothetical protein
MERRIISGERWITKAKCLLNRRDIFKQNRSATMAEWHQLAA